MKKLALVVISAVLFGCSANDEAYRILTSEGYTNVETTGYAFFGCSQGDTFHTGFTAMSPNNTYVTGVVCSGWFKGATIRRF